MSGRPNRLQAGFTIIEFMVAVGLFSVLMLAVAQSFPVQQRTYVVTDQVAEAKQNVRVIADLMERDIRNAGYMVPRTAALCGVDDDVGSDKLYVSDYTRIGNLGTLPSNLLNVPLGAEISGAPVSGYTATAHTFMVDRVDLDTLGGGSDFVVGSGVIVADRNVATRGVACGMVTGVGNTSLASIPVTVELENPTGALASGTQLVLIPAVVYEVDNNGVLLRNGVALVDQVEDLQVAWFFDLNGDRNVDPGEYIADGQGGADDYDAEALDATQLREVRINLVVRTRDDDPNDSWRQGIGQALENRTVGSVPAADGARRRTHTSTIRLRNNVS